MQSFKELTMSGFLQISHLLATKIRVAIKNYIKKSLIFSILHYNLLNDATILQKRGFV